MVTLGESGSRRRGTPVRTRGPRAVRAENNSKRPVERERSASIRQRGSGEVNGPFDLSDGFGVDDDLMMRGKISNMVG